ncbi:hypothetical protein GBA65_10625 [Rubrobacter marinus]|uniref:DUF4367 domain-containing protein n=1 Tax=Rubrobacter marinus TaxID=2653852 RepID=A0A6G8PXF0_9ACTN|nr:hypothetical protein [Rubrobacter marinus]QIN78901.1 hypothetical protein GBA65_10625 [Rubrobacter marinus]
MTEARDEVGRLLLPESPELTGEPRALYDAGSPRRAGVVLVFGPGPDLRPLGDTDAGLLLVEVPGSLASAYPGVATASRPSSEEVDVGGRRGYWFPDGRKLRPQPGEAERLPGGALLWEQGEATLLLRAGIPREEAVRIAETVR